MAKELILNFETEKLYEDFTGWFCDGGGEDGFYMAQDDCDRPKFTSKIIFENNKVKSINFKECDEE